MIHVIWFVVALILVVYLVPRVFVWFVYLDPSTLYMFLICLPGILIVSAILMIRKGSEASSIFARGFLFWAIVPLFLSYVPLFVFRPIDYSGASLSGLAIFITAIMMGVAAGTVRTYLFIKHAKRR